MNLVLNHEGYEPYLVSREEVYGGIQYLFKFENQYGASVVKHDYSEGHRADLWELAIIKRDDCGEWDFTYVASIEIDVEGCLTNEEVIDLLKQIKEL